MAGNALSQQEQTPYITIFNKERVSQIWERFVDMTLNKMESKFIETGSVPTNFVPLDGGFMPITYVVEGAYKRTQSESEATKALWGNIYEQLTQRDELGFKNIIFTIKTDTRKELDGSIVYEYEFSRGVEDVNNPLIVDDIADSLKTYEALAGLIHPDIEMCAATCKSSTDEILKKKGNKRIHVPINGVIPYLDDEDPWAFSGIGMNRQDEQGPQTSARQRAAGIVYTAINCELGGDLKWLISNIPTDDLVTRYSERGFDMLRALYELDEAKYNNQFELVLELANSWLNQCVNNMPYLVA